MQCSQRLSGCNTTKHTFLHNGACVRAARHPRVAAVTVVRAAAAGDAAAADGATASTTTTGRRAALQLGLAAPALLLLNAASPTPPRAAAVQGLTAGRIPGVSAEPDAEGFYTYTRPEGKSGGHGVGWSEIPRYSFRVPAGWDETPVSIADLGGTEIDLRFSNREQGDLAVVVAPIARFAEIGFNADVRIDQLGAPETLIAGFAPELYGSPLNEGDVEEQRVVKPSDGGGLEYYQWLVKPHRLVSATAVGNRLFIMAVRAPTARLWRKHEAELRAIQESFRVPAK